VCCRIFHIKNFPVPINFFMETKILQDGAESFSVSVHESDNNSPMVLFAVGSGGLPERYATLLEVFVKSGYTVVAPHFERLVSPFPKEEELNLRARRLSLALDAFSQSDSKVAGVGHSIGAATLLALVGAQMWLGPGRRIEIAPDNRLVRLALLATPAGFFQAPEALDAVRVPMLAWVGSEDDITPPAQSEWLAQAMSGWQTVDLRVTDGAGHFSFMDLTPPNTTEPLSNKHEFIQKYSSEVSKFVAG
jgi:pimeloyl-ACP methyl ester carboxylesterase